MSDSFDKMVEEFTNHAELLEFSKAQHKTIVELTRKVQNLEKKLKNTNNSKLIKKEHSDILKVSDEEIICRTQLNLLREIAMERELTLEETRKVDMYSKILIALSDKPKTIEVKTKGMKDDELLAVLENDEKTK